MKSGINTLINIDDNEKIICIYGEVSDADISLLKKYKPKYTIANFISGKSDIKEDLKKLILQNA